MKRRILQKIMVGGLFLLTLALLYGCAHVPQYSPTASFRAEPSIGTAPLTVSFDASHSFAAGVSPPPPGMFYYIWDFDDNNHSAVGMVVEHTFEEPGTYGVQLMLTYTEGRMAGMPASGTIRFIVVLPENQGK